MKKVLQDALSEAKTLPRGLWIAALVVPGGLATITVYLASKSIYKSLNKKENKDDRSEDSGGQHRPNGN